MENKSYTTEERLLKLNECFLGFGSDPLVNINLLVALCGELMNATCALYNSLQDDMLCSLGQWNIPPGYQSIDHSEGHLCTDIIRSTGETTTVIRNLQDTPYALTDPNVKLYHLKTYIGKAVKFNNINIGSLCAVYQSDVIPDNNELRLMEIIASAIGVEEDRKHSAETVQVSEEKYRLMFANNPQPMWIFDVETLAFLEVNQAAVNHYGYSEEEFLSMTIKDIRPAEDLPELLKHIDPTDIEFKELGEFRHVKKNGDVINVQITWHSVISNDRKARHVLVNDITDRKRAEALLREVNDRIRKISSQLPGVVYQMRLRTDGNFCFPYASEAMYDFFGIRPDEVQEDASKIFSLIHPDDFKDLFATAQESAKNLSSWQQEFRMKSENGNCRILFGNAVPQMEDDGSVLWHGFMSDITEHKRAKKALEESEANLTAVFNATDESVFLVSADYTLLALNNMAAQRIGPSPNELIGRNICDLMTPDVLAHRKPYIDRVLSGKESVKFEDERNGRWMVNYLYPILNADNNVVRMAIFSRDITEHKRADILQKEVHERLQKIADQLPGVVYQMRLHTDGSYSFPYASDTLYNFFGIRPDEVRKDASKIFSMIHPHDYESLFASVQKSAKNLSSWQQEFRLKSDDGNYRILFGNAVPHLEDDGSMVWHGFMSDITEHKRAKEALEESEANLSAILTATDESVSIVSVDNILLSMNKIAAQRIGHTRQELIGRKMDDILPPDVFARRQPYISRLLSTRESVKFEDERNGRWMVNYLYPILNADNKVIRIAIFSREITERKQAENALTIQNDYLSKLTQFSIDLSKLSSDENLEAFIPKRIKELTGAVAAVYSEYDEESRLIIPKQIEIEPRLLKKVVGFLGNQVQKIHSPVNDDVYKEITTSIVGKPKTLTEATFGAIPKLIGDKISEMIRADRYIALIYLIEGKLFGSTLLAMNDQQSDPPIEILRNIAFLVAVALRRKRAETLQKEALNRLVKIAGQLPGVVYQYRLRPDGSSSFPYVSENVSDIFGFRPDELHEDASKAFALLQPDDLANTFDAIRVSAKDLSPCQFEIPVGFVGDPIRTLFINAVPQREEDGSVLWHGFIADITEHKRAEVALLESRQFTEEIINSIPVGVFWKDRNLAYLGCNRQFTRDAGFDDPKEIIGKDDIMLGGDADRIEKYHNDDIEVLRSGKSLLLIEDRQTMPDGNIITALINKIPLLNHKGEIIGVLGTYMDITERKRYEESLIASEIRYRRLFESAKDGILILDAETGKIVDVNPFLYNLLGFSEEQLIDKKIWEIGLFKDIADNQSKFLELQKMKYIRYDDLPLETIDGRKINVEFVSNVYLADKKKVIQCNIRDITARKRVEAQLQIKHLQLQKINAEKDKFFSIIAHDLRSPFNGFLGLTEIMASELTDMTSEEIKKMAFLMKKSATNLFGLLGNLLEWSRMQRGLIAFVPEQFFLLPKISESLVFVKEAADKKDILINYAVPEDLMIFADENMFCSILRNLVTNAVKFTPKGGRITVSAKPFNDKLTEISVRDTGVGMDKILIKNLFHLDVNTSRKGTEGEYSTGLGLILSKDFIEKNGGELFIQSKVGKGSEFRFTVPCKSEPKE